MTSTRDTSKGASKGGDSSPCFVYQNLLILILLLKHNVNEYLVPRLMDLEVS